MAKLKSYTKKQLKLIKEAWEQLQKDTEVYEKLVGLTEGWLAKETGIKDIEFFKGESQGYVGVGNGARTFKLWQPKR